jgi:hypothetical protein
MSEKGDRLREGIRPWSVAVALGYLIVGAFLTGLVFIFSPEIGQRFVNGNRQWLDMIPEALFALIGTGWLGYIGAREWGKTVDRRQRTREIEAEVIQEFNANQKLPDIGEDT